MPDPLPIRDSLPNEPIRGVGGYMEFHWPDGPDPEQLKIGQWEIWHIDRNVELPMSGGFGAIGQRRVADHFRFSAALALDLLPTREHGPGPDVYQPHLDGRLEGSPANEFRISMKFCCGDPTFWTHPQVQTIARPVAIGDGVNYRCNSVLLDEVYTGNRVGKVVNCLVKGSGSATLRRYVGDVWCGAGAFGISQKEQGHVTTETGD